MVITQRSCAMVMMAITLALAGCTGGREHVKRMDKAVVKCISEAVLWNQYWNGYWDDKTFRDACVRDVPIVVCEDVNDDKQTNAFIDDLKSMVVLSEYRGVVIPLYLNDHSNDEIAYATQKESICKTHRKNIKANFGAYQDVLSFRGSKTDKVSFSMKALDQIVKEVIGEQMKGKKRKVTINVANYDYWYSVFYFSVPELERVGFVYFMPGGGEVEGGDIMNVMKKDNIYKNIVGMKSGLLCRYTYDGISLNREEK